MPKSTKQTNQPNAFELLVGASGDGRLQAVYFQLRSTKVVKTKEIIEDTVLADYDSRNRLVGVELLGPAKVSVIVKLVDKRFRNGFKRFVTQRTPPELLVA